MAGIPIYIPTSREGFKQWIKLVGVILIAVAIYFSATKIQLTQPNFVKEGTVPFSEMNESDVYEATDVIVFDNYATVTHHYVDYEYFSILIQDSDETAKYASVVTTSGDALYDQLMTFANDQSLAYGECVLNGGFTAQKMDNVKVGSDILTDLKKFYNEDVSACQQMLNATASDLVLTYACDSEADFPKYQEELKNDNIKWGAISAALIVGGILCIFIGVSMSKKDKKKAKELAEADAQYYNADDYYNPMAAAENAEETQQEYASVTSETVETVDSSTEE